MKKIILLMLVAILLSGCVTKVVEKEPYIVSCTYDNGLIIQGAIIMYDIEDNITNLITTIKTDYSIYKDVYTNEELSSALDLAYDNFDKQISYYDVEGVTTTLNKNTYDVLLEINVDLNIINEDRLIALGVDLTPLEYTKDEYIELTESYGYICIEK